MKESVYKTYEELPLFLNARIVAQVLGTTILLPTFKTGKFDSCISS